MLYTAALVYYNIKNTINKLILKSFDADLLLLLLQIKTKVVF